MRNIDEWPITVFTGSEQTNSYRCYTQHVYKRLGIISTSNIRSHHWNREGTCFQYTAACLGINFEVACLIRWPKETFRSRILKLYYQVHWYKFRAKRLWLYSRIYQFYWKAHRCAFIKIAKDKWERQIWWVKTNLT